MDRKETPQVGWILYIVWGFTVDRLGSIPVRVDDLELNNELTPYNYQLHRIPLPEHMSETILINIAL